MVAQAARLFLLVGLVGAAFGDHVAPFVHVRQGPLEGSLMTARSGRKFAAFTGIPYAKPPVGDLRFKGPVPAEPWNGVLNATGHTPFCAQITLSLPAHMVIGQEDCLYLNVYTYRVHNDSNQGLVPVMVYFHGGEYVSGGSSPPLVSPTNLLDKDIVLVTVNYRLGIFGFLSTGDSAAPGNFGLKDQVLALRWVRDNIGVFGGNPGLVTIFGEGSGGVSVELHMLSPASQGFFHRAITMSGSASASWASVVVLPLATAIHQGYLVGCNNSTSQQLVDCLRTIEEKQLVWSTVSLYDWQGKSISPYRLVVEPKNSKEEPFLDESPFYILRQAVLNPGSASFASVPWLTGINRDEGIVTAVSYLTNPSLLADINSRPDDLFPLILELQNHVASGDYGSTVDQVWNLIKGYYFPETQSGAPLVIGNFNNRTLIQLTGDRHFNYPAYLSILYHVKAGQKDIYVYKFDYRGEQSYSTVYSGSTEDWGVSFGDTGLYLLPSPYFFPKLPKGHRDWTVVEALVEIFTNFATYGRPTAPSYHHYHHHHHSTYGSCVFDLEDVEWPAVTSSSFLPYIQIEAANSSETSNVLQFCLRKDFLKERIDFWSSLPLIENTLDYTK